MNIPDLTAATTWVRLYAIAVSLAACTLAVGSFLLFPKEWQPPVTLLFFVLMLIVIGYLPELMRGVRHVSIGASGVEIRLDAVQAPPASALDHIEKSVPKNVLPETFKNFRLMATITPDPDRAEWALIKLALGAWPGEFRPAGDATFFLHPTFRNPVRRVPFADGMAVLTISAWGAFVVEAQPEGVAQKLAIDLSTVPGGPPLFYER